MSVHCGGVSFVPCKLSVCVFLQDDKKRHAGSWETKNRSVITDKILYRLP